MHEMSSYLLDSVLLFQLYVLSQYCVAPVLESRKSWRFGREIRNDFLNFLLHVCHCQPHDIPSPSPNTHPLGMHITALLVIYTS